MEATDLNRLNAAVIGGGSVNWMHGLMRDLYLLDELDGGSIRLVDPHQEHVEAVADMLRTFNRLRRKDYDIRIEDERRKALDGADIVLTTFSPGRMEAFFNDLEIPVKYGVRLPVSMTVGPCGISAALRTAPVAAQIVEDMEAVCPDAWLLNETNPMTVVTAAMAASARTVKVLGLCHGVHDLQHILGPALGLPRPEGMNILSYLYAWLNEQGLEYTFAGINHLIFLNKAVLRGEDVLPRIRDYCRENLFRGNGRGGRPARTEGVATAGFGHTHQAAMAICGQTGYFPINNDRHTVEFWPGLCNIRNGFGMKYGVAKTTVDGRRLRKAEQLEKIRRIARGDASIPWVSSGEELTEIIRAIVSGGRTKTVVNVPNDGQIENLPRGAIVETLGYVSRDGVEPVPSGELPGVPGAWTRLHLEVQELTLRAAMEGSRDLLVQALSLDPAASGTDFSELPVMAQELIEANQEWLPLFRR